jgi:hypothetical protein
MRHDIAKVICERQRCRSDEGSLRTARKLDARLDWESGDYDWGPVRLSSARRRQENGSVSYKHLNENLNPLFNFLDKAVGRHWDDVYSEICQNIDPRRAIGFHVLQHVGWHVEKRIRMNDDDMPMRTDGRYSWEYNGLYVHPETGILCDNPRPGKKVRYKKSAKPVTQLYWYDNFWFVLNTFATEAICGCVHFKVPAHPDHKNRYTFYLQLFCWCE